jgi:hypothetical protein
MSAVNDIINSYYSLKPSQYGYLETFKLYREISKEGCSDYFLELQMRSTSDFRDPRRLFLSFSGIKELKIGNLEGLLSLLIDIRSIQEYQFENVKYKVVESEYEAFSFLCLDIEAMVK